MGKLQSMIESKNDSAFRSAKWGFSGSQMVKNLPAMQETQVRSQGSEGPLEKERATHLSILAWRIPWTEETTVHVVTKSQTGLSD